MKPPETGKEIKNNEDPFLESVALMARLRAPGGCPWDREQTLDTIRKYTLEEVYEVIDAIDREHWDDLREELGDLFLQVLFYAQIAQDEGKFSIFEVLEMLNRKLVRRHPHVFGEAAAAAAGNEAELAKVAAANPAEVLRNWDAIKRAEKRTNHAKTGFLEAVPKTFPSLLEAAKLGSKAAKVGFDWPDTAGILDKLHEEVAELKAEVISSQSVISRKEEELGDLLFTIANLARHLKIDPELALRRANAKFRRRFAAMESYSDASLESLTAVELETLWNSVKAGERGQR
jgi:MazG family protein